MKKPIISCMLLGAFVSGVVAAKMHSRLAWARAGQPALCFDVPCAQFGIRLSAIESIISQLPPGPKYLAVGDSITEMADLPVICGRRPINAGISWATTGTFHTHGRRLAELAKPDFVVLALGTNDAVRLKDNGFRVRFTALLTSLAAWPVIVVPLPPGRIVPDVQQYNASIVEAGKPMASPLLSVENTPDGVHLTSSDYVAWKASIITAAERTVCAK